MPRKSCKFDAGAVGNEPWAHAGQWECLTLQTSVGAFDFVNDAFTDGRRFRILTVIDDYTRENLALVADTSLSGQRVSREPDQIVAERGMPATILSDNGTEFASMAILQWVQGNGIDWHYFAPASLSRMGLSKASTANYGMNV